MSVGRIHLDWDIDLAGYRIDGYGRDRRRLIGRGGSVAKRQPFNKSAPLYLIFSKIQSDDQLLRFVNRYGLLMTEGSDFEGERFRVSEEGALIATGVSAGFREDVGEHLETAQMFRAALRWKGKQRRPSRELAKWLEENLLDSDLGTFRLGYRRKFDVELCPDSLMSGMKFQLANALSGDQEFAACRYCGQLFEVGSGARRRDALFCSDEHKRHWHSQNRSRPK